MGLDEGFETPAKARQPVDEHTTKPTGFGVLQHALPFGTFAQGQCPCDAIIGIFINNRQLIQAGTAARNHVEHRWYHGLPGLPWRRACRGLRVGEVHEARLAVKWISLVL